MKVEFNKGENIEEMFGFDDKQIDKMINFLKSLFEEGVEFDEGVARIYKKARNSKELGYMLIYYTAIAHAIEFNQLMEDSAEVEIEHKGGDEGMFW